jgi:hypothetical protein
LYFIQSIRAGSPQYPALIPAVENEDHCVLFVEVPEAEDVLSTTLTPTANPSVEPCPLASA